jgi:periplasmic protein TonB
MDRRFLIVTAVVGFHLVALWALHTGLLRRAVELVIPVQVLAELIEAPQPVVAPASPAPQPPQPVARQQPTMPSPKPAPRPAPAPVAPATPKPAPPLASAITMPPVTTAAPTTATAPLAAEVAAPAAPAPPRIDLPSSSADYLNNPPPPYPPLSKRMGEQGQVVVRTRIEANGTASQAEIRTSSGFERLDRAALETVKRWRYVPGTRGGVPEAMWFNIPIRFVLD